MTVLTATHLRDAGVSTDSPDYLSFLGHFGQQVEVTENTVSHYAADFRWDHLAARLFSEEDHDAYVETIYEPLQLYGQALFQARLTFRQSNLSTGLETCMVIRKKMRFHRARLQEAKAKAFLAIYTKSRGAVSCSV